jgi:hypothetical protein
MENKTFMVSQLDNVSSTSKGMKKWNINVTCYQPKGKRMELDGMDGDFLFNFQKYELNMFLCTRTKTVRRRRLRDHF